MAKFRKKPVVIEAVTVREIIYAATRSWSELPAWLAEAYEKGDVLLLPDAVEVLTLKGTMRGGLDDYIIRGVKGELYPCKPDIFAATYDPE